MKINKDIQIIKVDDGILQEIKVDGESFVRKAKVSATWFDEWSVNDPVEIGIDWAIPNNKMCVTHAGETISGAGKNVDASHKAKELLGVSKNNNVLIGLYDESNRGIGKTTELIKMAHKEDAILVTGNLLVIANQTKEYANRMNLDIDIRTFDKNVVHSGMTNKKFVVDELVTMEVIQELIKQGNKLAGGFINLNFDCK